MRKAQSTRHYPRPSLALGADDLGILRENADETVEDALRRQLLEKDRENDKLQTQLQSLQVQLSQRPPLETIQAIRKEYTNLEILLQGTQRENERCMAEIERGKSREKMLERELEKLAGANWQANLDITSSSASLVRSPPMAGSGHMRRGSAATPPPKVDAQSTMAHIEQVRLLILGMEQRLQAREDKLAKSIEKAELEGERFEAMRKQVLAATAP